MLRTVRFDQMLKWVETYKKFEVKYAQQPQKRKRRTANDPESQKA